MSGRLARGRQSKQQAQIKMNNQHHKSDYPALRVQSQTLARASYKDQIVGNCLLCVYMWLCIWNCASHAVWLYSCYCFEFCLCLFCVWSTAPPLLNTHQILFFDEIRGHFPFLSLKDFQWKLQTKFSIEVMLLDVLFWFKLHSNKCNDKIHIEKTLNFVKTIAYLGYGPKQLLYRDWTDNRAHHPKVKISLKRFFINSRHTPLNISVCRWQLLLRTAKRNRQHQQQSSLHVQYIVPCFDVLRIKAAWEPFFCSSIFGDLILFSLEICPLFLLAQIEKTEILPGYASAYGYLNRKLIPHTIF